MYLKETLKQGAMNCNALFLIKFLNTKNLLKHVKGLRGNIKIVAVFLTLYTVCLNAQNNERLFAAANQMYQSGNYTAAAEQYEQILKSRALSKETYYNLGNTYFRLNQIGRAMLNYERALRFSPSDADILYNIAIAKTKLVDDIESVDDTFIIRWLRQLRGVLSSDGWSAFGLFFLWIGISGLVVWLLGAQRLWKKRGFIAGLVLIPLSCIPFLLANSTMSTAQSNQYAIIMALETPLRPVPDTSATTTMLLHEGLKVIIQDSNEHFINVRLPNGEVGWLERPAVEKIF
jgi:tetratricopeptide (TPR) repeat protein